MIPSRESHDVMGGHLEVLRQFRAVPRCAVWDQEGAIGCWHDELLRLGRYPLLVIDEVGYILLCDTMEVSMA